ncbi:hypothetical protein SRHO_G00191140 [Serrasalmus rhombeus]
MEDADFSMGDMDVMEGGDMDVMEGEDMDVMEGEDVEGGYQGAEECDEGGNEMKFKAKLPRHYRQGPQKRRVRVRVKDYMCFSIISNMFFNILLLGLLALKCSLRARHRCYRGDIKGAKRFAKCALIANLVALILTIVFIVLLSIICSLNANECLDFLRKEKCKS